VTRIDVSWAAEQEFLESVEGSGTQRLRHATEGDLYRVPLRTRDGYELEQVRERARPIGDEVILRQADVRVTVGDHLGHIPMCDTEAARKGFDLGREERISGGFPDQRLDRRPITRPSPRFRRVGRGQAAT